jgi:uncharacterized tellurite resistance protein B-like protein
MADAVQRLTPQESIIFLMVMSSASDGRITERELRAIGRVVRSYSLFTEDDESRLVATAEACGRLMSSEGGLHKVLETAKSSLPRHLAETAYAAVLDVVTADESLEMTEIRVLDLIRATLGVSDEGAAALERSARARHMTIADAQD